MLNCFMSKNDFFYHKKKQRKKIQFNLNPLTKFSPQTKL